MWCGSYIRALFPLPKKLWYWRRRHDYEVQNHPRVCLHDGHYAAISVLGCLDMGEAQTGLNEFRRLARINVGLSDALADFNEASTDANLFLSFRGQPRNCAASSKRCGNAHAA